MTMFEKFWTTCIFTICIIFILVRFGFYIRDFMQKPKDEQIEQVKNWLVWAVIEAEKTFGNKTGSLKLVYVYDKFITRFPKLANEISFDLFSSLVDKALEVMRDMIKKNENISSIITQNEGTDNE